MASDTIVLLYVDPDGTPWHWLTGDEGVTLAGADGFDLASFSQIIAQGARQVGRTYRGTRTDALKLPLKLEVGDGALSKHAPRYGDAWRALQARVRRSLDPRRTGRLYVITGSGGYRWVDVRRDEWASAETATNPADAGMGTYNVVLVADFPYWQGLPTEAALPATGGVVRLANRGELESWPVWTVKGPTSGTASVTVGSGPAVATLPALSAGQSVIFDTRTRTILDATGASRRGELTAHDLRAPVPAGAVGALTVSVSGSPITGSVSLPHLYEGAW